MYMDYKKDLDKLVLTLLREGGSDLHLGTGRFPAARINRSLILLRAEQKPTQEVMIEYLKVLLGEEKLKIFLDTQEVDFSYTYTDEHTKTRLRGNAFIEKGNIAIALRAVPAVSSFEELHLPQVLDIISKKKQGFFLVVGPVGQGKSTTLAALVDKINSERAEHIITIEDPIEHIFEEKQSIINQREIGIDSKSFAGALNSIFREDANVIMLGEMRNPETIQTAVTAAETGHLVVSTLHTNNAVQTIDRIVDSFPPGQQDQIRIQLAGSLIGIFSQRLIPRIAGGLVPAYELLLNNEAVANLIREKRTHEIAVLIETGFENGMVDMNRCLIDLVRDGEITLENAYNYSLNPKALQNLL
jgi:twitching motility protein PilT